MEDKVLLESNLSANHVPSGRVRGAFLLSFFIFPVSRIFGLGHRFGQMERKGVKREEEEEKGEGDWQRV